MEVEIINKTNEDIQNRYNAKVSTINFSGKYRISFTAHAAEECNLRVGDYLHFVILNKVWCFYTNKDKTGFKLFMLNKSKQNGVCISSYPMSRMFAERTGHKGQCKFYIKDAHAEFQGNKLYEILTHKPIHAMGK